MRSQERVLCPKCGYPMEPYQECGACLIERDRRAEFWTGYFFGSGVLFLLMWLYATWMTHV